MVEAAEDLDSEVLGFGVVLPVVAPESCCCLVEADVPDGCCGLTIVEDSLHGFVRVEPVAGRPMLVEDGRVPGCGAGESVVTVHESILDRLDALVEQGHELVRGVHSEGNIWEVERDDSDVSATIGNVVAVLVLVVTEK